MPGRNKTTRDYLQSIPFSAHMIERFFEPFFGGVFLERELVTSSRFFEFLFRMFSAGDTAVPAEGMQQIPLQLAAKLPAGTLVTGARVAGVTRNAESFAISIDNMESLEAHAVVLAVAGNEGNALLAGVGGWSVPEVRAWNQTTAFCYAAEQPPVDEPVILLNGEGPGAGPVNNVVVMSAVSPDYAPPGAHLVVASVVGEAPREAGAAAAIGRRRAHPFEKLVWPRRRLMENPQSLSARPGLAPTEACRVGAGAGAVGRLRWCLHVWRLPRNRLHPGRPGLGQESRRGRPPRPARPGKRVAL